MKQKVAILGFGVEGQDAARFFLKKGAKISVFDKKAKKEVANGWKDKEITWVCGPTYLKQGFSDFDLVVRSPGFYRFHPTLVAAEKKGTKITSSTILFFQNCKTPIIGVTGTKGKGTTAKMIELGLKNSGLKVVLAGNIGEPMLSLLDQANQADWVVLELSSFQTIDLAQSPHIAVATHIAVDHLDWHKNKEEYVRAKENLWRHQTKEDFLVVNQDDATTLALAAKSPGAVRFYSVKKMPVVAEASDLRVPGQHNLLDALAALAACELAGADLKKAWQGIASYQGAEHRLERVAEKAGVLYINDSAATTPDAAQAAIQSYPQPKILILGGSAKGAKFDQLAKNVVGGNVKAVILMGKTAQAIGQALKKVGFARPVKEVKGDMSEVVKTAQKLARVGDVILLSPACASFDMFKNYQDRGAKFKEAVLR